MRPQISPEELQRIYTVRFDTEMEYRLKVWKVLVEHFFSRYIGPDASVLDLGCGYGQFINNIQARQKYAIDMNPSARKLLSRDVTFLEQDCTETWPLPSESLDMVFTSNFFEHLADKRALSSTLGQAYRCLRPNGRIVAMGPNIKFTGSAYWDFFDHHLPLTEQSLKEGMEISGFHSQVVIARFLPYTMVNAPHYPTGFLRAYLSLPFLWRFLGQQFLVIASKSRA